MTIGTCVLASAGPAASDLGTLGWWLFGLGTAVYVLVMALLLSALLRRRTAGDAPPPTARPEVPSGVANRWIVAGGVVLPAVVLPAALALTVRTMEAVPVSAPPGSLVIEVVGRQWWWSAHYPGEGITVANEIHIPVGEPVEIRLTSADVIHSFWVPELAGKLDALPDGTNTLVVQADEPGEYRGHCAEFCGLQHAKMGLLVIAEPRERFGEWVASQRRPGEEAREAEALRGQAVFLRSRCADCHTVRGTSAAGEEGPDLTHFASRRTLAAATLRNTADHLARWLTDPDAVKEGSGMPPARLTDADLDAVVAYLRGLE